MPVDTAPIPWPATRAAAEGPGARVDGCLSFRLPATPQGIRYHSGLERKPARIELQETDFVHIIGAILKYTILDSIYCFRRRLTGNRAIGTCRDGRVDIDGMLDPLYCRIPADVDRFRVGAI